MTFFILMNPYFLYILYSDKIDKYYIGVSTDYKKRLVSHNQYPKGWTKGGIPWRLVYFKEFESKPRAMFWEQKLKRIKRRDIIEKIINNEFTWLE